MTDHVWLYNPDTEAMWQAPADYAHIARARGWVDSDGPVDEFADAAADTVPAEIPPAEDIQTGFDPSEHGFKEVLDYLNQYRDTAPGEVERVLSLERAGKNRKTITGE
jgi:hypothetical protein